MTDKLYVATGLEPLSQNIEAYNWTLGSYLGYGLSGACFRGHRVYDSPAVEDMVRVATPVNKHFVLSLILHSFGKNETIFHWSRHGRNSGSGIGQFWRWT